MTRRHGVNGIYARLLAAVIAMGLGFVGGAHSALAASCTYNGLVSWTNGGNTCSTNGSFSASDGGSATVTNTAPGLTGAATYWCSSGLWNPNPSNISCNKDCSYSGIVQWANGGSGTDCSNTSTFTAHSGSSVTVTNTKSGYTGQATYSCTNGTFSTAPTSATCVANAVNGVCGATHYNCTAGTSSNNVSGASSYTWSCLGSNGGSTASCSEAKAIQTMLTLSGYAWSSNIGWISFSGANYGVVGDATTGNLSGYAWSPNIGWVSFGQTSGCPGSGCTTQPNVNLTTGAVTGWAKALSADNNGWDGWIKLGGSWSPGAHFNTPGAPSSSAAGYSWGSDVVGWLSWNGVLMTKTASLAPTASLLVNGSSSATVTSGAKVTLSWNSTNAATCTAYGPWSNSGTLSGSGFSNPITAATTFQFQCAASDGTLSPMQTATVTVTPTGCSATTISNCSLPASATGAVPYGTCVNGTVGPCRYSCDGGNSWTNYMAMTCVTPCPTHTGTVTWQSGGNTCSTNSSFSEGAGTNWAVVTNTAPGYTGSAQYWCSGGAWLTTPTNMSCSPVVLPASVTLSASPTRVQSGNHTYLTWLGTNATSCTVTGTNGFSQTGKTGTSVDAGAITSQTTFTANCDSGAATAQVIVNIVPRYNEF